MGQQEMSILNEQLKKAIVAADADKINETGPFLAERLRERIAMTIDNTSIDQKWEVCRQWLIMLKSFKIELTKPDDIRSKYNTELSKHIDFLCRWLQQLQTNYPETVAMTLNTNLTAKQLIDLCRLLINGGYVETISVNIFKYLLSGNKQADTPKIKWLKAKKILVYLLDKICIDFSFPVANHCFAVKGKKLDSNDRNKYPYNEIDNLLQELSM